MRIFKIIFFFLFITPGQTDAVSVVQESDTPNDHGDLVQGITAMVNESVPLNTFRSSKKKISKPFIKKIHGYGLQAELAFSSLPNPLLNNAVLAGSLFDTALVSEQWIRYCLRSKSSSLSQSGDQS